MLLLAHPQVATTVFYLLFRLAPEGCIADGISFSTCEATANRRLFHLVAVPNRAECSDHRPSRDFRQIISAYEGAAVRQFSHCRRLYPQWIVQTFAANPETARRIVRRIQKAGVASPATLEEIAAIDCKIRGCLTDASVPQLEDHCKAADPLLQDPEKTPLARPVVEYVVQALKQYLERDVNVMKTLAHSEIATPLLQIQLAHQQASGESSYRDTRTGCHAVGGQLYRLE